MGTHIQVSWKRRDSNSIEFQDGCRAAIFDDVSKNISMAVSEILIMNPTRCCGKRIKSVGETTYRPPGKYVRVVIIRIFYRQKELVFEDFDKPNQTLNIKYFATTRVKKGINIIIKLKKLSHSSLLKKSHVHLCWTQGVEGLVHCPKSQFEHGSLVGLSP